MLTVVLHDRSGNSQHKINNKVKDWKRLRGRSASFYLKTWWNPRHHWLRGLSFPISEMPRSKKGYVRWVTRDCGVPQSYSHSLSFPCALRRIDFCWSILRDRMCQGRDVLTRLPELRDGVVSQILPRKAVGKQSPWKVSWGFMLLLVCASPFFSLCFIVFINTRRLIFLNRGNYLY